MYENVKKKEDHHRYTYIMQLQKIYINMMLSVSNNTAERHSYNRFHRTANGTASGLWGFEDAAL